MFLILPIICSIGRSNKNSSCIISYYTPMRRSSRNRLCYKPFSFGSFHKLGKRQNSQDKNTHKTYRKNKDGSRKATKYKVRNSWNYKCKSQPQNSHTLSQGIEFFKMDSTLLKESLAVFKSAFLSLKNNHIGKIYQSKSPEEREDGNIRRKEESSAYSTHQSQDLSVHRIVRWPDFVSCIFSKKLSVFLQHFSSLITDILYLKSLYKSRDTGRFINFNTYKTGDIS